MNTATTAPKTLTRSDLDDMAQDGAWLGHGYLGERRNFVARLEETGATSAEFADKLLAEVDQAVLDDANANGYEYADLFEWANSKAGRWFADVVLGGMGSLEERLHDAQRFHLVPSAYTFED